MPTGKREQPPPVDLSMLVRWVRGRTTSCTELDRLSLAVKVGIHLDRMSDELVGQFVEEARRSGASWSQIGERLGVTKQAAQQRHTVQRTFLNRLRPRRERGQSRMWERFGDSAQKVVAHAQEEAGRLGHNYIGTEHLLLGVLRERTSRGAEVLAARGVSLGAVRKRIDDIVGKGTAPVAGPIPFVPRAKRVLQLAVGEAETMGHHLVDPEHIVLAILAEGEGVAARILRDLGVSEQAVRDRLGKKRPSQ